MNPCILIESCKYFEHKYDMIYLVSQLNKANREMVGQWGSYMLNAYGNRAKAVPLWRGCMIGINHETDEIQITDDYPLEIYNRFTPYVNRHYTYEICQQFRNIEMTKINTAMCLRNSITYEFSQYLTLPSDMKYLRMFAKLLCANVLRVISDVGSICFIYPVTEEDVIFNRVRVVRKGNVNTFEAFVDIGNDKQYKYFYVYKFRNLDIGYTYSLNPYNPVTLKTSNIFFD